MDLTAMETDRELERGGVWVPVSDTVELLVARAGNPAHEARLNAYRKQHERWLENTTNSTDEGIVARRQDILRDIGAKAAAGTVLKGWRWPASVTGPVLDGEPLGEFTTQKAAALMLRNDPFFKMVGEIANDEETYRRRQVADAVGNSATASAGNSSSEAKHGD